MLKKGELYNPKLYKKAELLPTSREITVEQAVFIIQRKGYLVTTAS
jgi:transposase